MKAPDGGPNVDRGGCRHGALRSGEQRLAFEAGEELGGSNFEFQELRRIDEVLSTHHVDVDAEFNVLAVVGQHAAGEFVLLVDRRDAHRSGPVNLIADVENLAARQVEGTGRADHRVGELVKNHDGYFQVQRGPSKFCQAIVTLNDL